MRFCRLQPFTTSPRILFTPNILFYYAYEIVKPCFRGYQAKLTISLICYFKKEMATLQHTFTSLHPQPPPKLYWLCFEKYYIIFNIEGKPLIQKHLMRYIFFPKTYLQVL